MFLIIWWWRHGFWRGRLTWGGFFLSGRGRSIGGHRSWGIGPRRRQTTWRKWRGMWENASTTCHFSKLNSEISPSPRKLYLANLISYANRAAWFISAYNQGLSGPEAAWASRKPKKSMAHSRIIYSIFQPNSQPIFFFHFSKPHIWLLLALI